MKRQVVNAAIALWMAVLRNLGKHSCALNIRGNQHALIPQTLTVKHCVCLTGFQSRLDQRKFTTFQNVFGYLAAWAWPGPDQHRVWA